jgi:hypothetical protein
MRRSVLIDEITGEVPEVPDYVNGFKNRGVVEPKNITTSSSPVAGNDSSGGQDFSIGSRWINTATGAVYFCVDASIGAAVWIDNTAGAGGDMVAATYDPTNVNGDAFLRTNHAGTQLASTVSDFASTVTANATVAANAAFVGGDGAANTAHRGLTGSNPHGTDGDQLISTGEAAGRVLEADGAGGVQWATASGGGGTPAGVDRDIQINDSGAFGAGAEGGFKLGADKALSVFGESNSSSAIDNAPLGKGTLSVGYQQGNSSGTARIGNATNRGGVSFGSMQFNTGASGDTLIECTGRGGLVGGSTYFPNSYFSGDRVIRSSGNGAVAFGYLKTTNSGSQTIEASGKASLAMAFSDSPNTTCLASGNGSVQFGNGTNSKSNSVAVGANLRLNGDYGAPYPKRNGDIWVTYTYPSYLAAVHIHSQGATTVL